MIDRDTLEFSNFQSKSLTFWDIKILSRILSKLGYVSIFGHSSYVWWWKNIKCSNKIFFFSQSKSIIFGNISKNCLSKSGYLFLIIVGMYDKLFESSIEIFIFLGILSRILSKLGYLILVIVRMNRDGINRINCDGKSR